VVEPGRDLAQIAGELAEDQHAVPLVGGLLQQGHQGVQFRRRRLDLGLALIDQAGVDRQLTQPGQGGQHLDLVVVHVIGQLQHPLTLPLQLPVVDPPVGRRQIDLDDLLLLGGKVEGDLILRPAQQERGDAASQQRHPLAVHVVLAFDRTTERLPELLRTAQQTRRG